MLARACCSERPVSWATELLTSYFEFKISASTSFSTNAKQTSFTSIEQIKFTESNAKDFIQKYFGVEWPDRGVYHTMINTTIGNRAVVDTILDLVKIVNASLAA